MSEADKRPEQPAVWQRLADWVVGTNLSGAPESRPRIIQNSMPLSGITSRSGSYWEMFTGAAPGLAPLSPANAPAVTAVHACTALIAGAISALPIRVYQRLADNERAELPNDDLWWLLNEEFNPRWSAAKGWEYVVLALLLRGDGFAIIERRGSRIVGLRPVHPACVDVRPSNDGRRLLYRVTFGMDDGIDMAGSRVYDQDDILHFPGFGFDGLRGMSPLSTFLRMSASVAAALQQYTGQFFAQGARPDYVLSGDLTPEQLDEMRAQVDAYHSGLNNARRPMLLTGGVELKTISLPLEDVQLLSLRQFQVEEIARAYLVPPFMIGHNEKTTSWGSGVEAMGVGFVRYTLRNYLNGITAEINRKLLPRSTKFLEFDTSELERADFKSMIEAFRTAIGRAGEPGFMTPDEVRTRLNLKRLPGGDVLNPGQTGGTANAPAD
jgi:HK97 family phage portal protein